MTATQFVLAAIALSIIALGAIYHRSPLSVDKTVNDPVVEVVRWVLLVPTAIMLLGDLVVPDRLDWVHLPLPDWVRIVGGITACLATLGVARCFAALGQNFAATLVVRQGHGLVTHGPYRYVRHPMYTLGFAMLLGLGMMTTNGLVLFAGPAAMLILMIVRVPKEERMLAEHFGEEWDAYASRTGRLLPQIPGK